MRHHEKWFVALLSLVGGCAVPVEGEVDGDHRVTVGFSWPNELPKFIRLAICTGSESSAVRACVNSKGFGLFDTAQCPEVVVELRKEQCEDLRCEPGRYEQCLCPSDEDPAAPSGWRQCGEEDELWGECDCPGADDETLTKEEE